VGGVFFDAVDFFFFVSENFQNVVLVGESNLSAVVLNSLLEERGKFANLRVFFYIKKPRNDFFRRARPSKICSRNYFTTIRKQKNGLLSLKKM
jgi:hypothetical protein